MTRRNLRHRILARQLGAQARAEAASQRTPEEQLACLIDRGHGHCAEAHRLKESI